MSRESAQRVKGAGPILRRGGMRFSACVTWLALVLPFVCGPAAKAQASWIGATSATASHPTGRIGAALAYDSVRDRMVMWGGHDGIAQCTDTWEAQNVPPFHSVILWTPCAPAVSPPPCESAAMTFDRGRARVVLVGWTSGSLSSVTWEYDGITWTPRSFAVHPTLGTSQFLLLYDAWRGVCVLTVQGGLQTWEYNGYAWTQRSVGTPAPRNRAALVYDYHRQRSVLHGGLDPTSQLPLGDTWEYDGNAWHLVTSGPLLVDCSAVYDLHRRRAVFVHRDAVTTRTHEYDGSWQAVNTQWPTVPTTRPSLAYDSRAAQAVSFGGDIGAGPLPLAFFYRSSSPATVEPFGQGCSGAWIAPSFAPQPYHVPYLGMDFGLRFWSAPWNQPSVVAFGTSNAAFGSPPVPLPLSLQAVGMPGCTLYTSADILLSTTVSGANATASFPVPMVPQLVGARFYLQGFAAEPGGNPAGLIATVALDCRIGLP